MSDERLVRRAAAGDERAFAAIFRRYNQDLYRYCLAILGNPADAQDALQNAMVKALRALPGERREIKLKPWLYRVAHNEAIELLRQRREEPLDPEAAAPDPGVAETVEVRQRLRRLFADLGQLPHRQRGALAMRELSGLGFEEIGAALDTSAAVARQTVYEARLGLREMEAGREMSCDAVTRALSDGDGRTLRRRDVRAHLRACPKCRDFQDGIERRRRDFAALSPLPALAAAALLKGALGSAASGGSAAGASLGGGAAAGATAATAPVTGGAAVGAGAAMTGAAGGAAGAAGAVGGIGVAAKTAATVAVVAALGVGAADRTGLVRVTGSDGEGTAETAPAPAAGANAPAGGDATGSTGPAEPASQPSGPPRSPDGASSGAPASKGDGDEGDAPSPAASVRGDGGRSGGQGGKAHHPNSNGTDNSAKGNGPAPSGRGSSTGAGRSPGNGKGSGGSAGERGKGAGGAGSGSAEHAGAGEPSKDRGGAAPPQTPSGKQSKGGPANGSAPAPGGKQTAPKAEPLPEAPALPHGQAKQAESPAPERGDAGPPAGAVETSP